VSTRKTIVRRLNGALGHGIALRSQDVHCCHGMDSRLRPQIRQAQFSTGDAPDVPSSQVAENQSLPATGHVRIGRKRDIEGQFSAATVTVQCRHVDVGPDSCLLTTSPPADRVTRIRASPRGQVTVIDCCRTATSNAMAFRWRVVTGSGGVDPAGLGLPQRRTQTTAELGPSFMIDVATHGLPRSIREINRIVVRNGGC
jgi:hypothetical protein